MLKRWPTREPAAATGELARLQFACGRGLPAPSPLAVDPSGDWFGWPALVMAHLSGQVVLRAAPGPWIAQSAETLVQIHRAPLPTSLDPEPASVDWHDARVGPAASDVAYATVDLVRTNGVRAADLFVSAYEAAAGSLDDLPRWQALWLASQLPWMHRWTSVRPEPNGKTLTRALVTRRLRSFADRIITQL